MTETICFSFPEAVRLMCKDMCGDEIMATNLELDDRLIRQAVKLGKHRTKKAAVTQALTDYVSRLKQEAKCLPVVLHDFKK